MKKLKYLHKYILLGILAMQAASCVNDEYGQDSITPEERVVVNLFFTTAQTAAGNDPLPDAGNPENQIKSLRVYIFSGSELVGYQPKTDIPENTASKTLEMQLCLSNKSIPNEGYPCTFYIITNEDAAGGLKSEGSTTADYTLPEPTQDTATRTWKLPEGTTEATFKNIKFTRLPEAALVDGSTQSYTNALLPMTAIHTENIKKSTQEITIPLQRSVAKLSLYFAKYGTGELYIDRGIYLYNVPEEGYLFPPTSLTQDNIGTIENQETDPGKAEAPDSNHQRGGKELLPPSYTGSGTTPAHTNAITAEYPLTGGGTENTGNYQLLPAKPIYMFAHYTGVTNGTGTGTVETDKGYYVKFLFHKHENNDDEGGNSEYDKHDGEIYRIFLPEVNANDEVQVFSRIYMKGYIELQLHWMVAAWKTGGGDIDFN